MDVTIRKAEPATRAAGMLALGVFEAERTPTAAVRAVDRAARGAIAAVLGAGDFRGRPGETHLMYAKGLKAKRVLLVGLGPRAALTRQRLMTAAATAARRARDLGAGSLALALHEAGSRGADEAAAAVAEGAVLGHYRHTAYRTAGAAAPLDRIELFEPAAAAARRLRAAVERGARLGEAVSLARDLANTPGADLVPEQLAARAREIARGADAKCTVHDVAAMERFGMNGVLAVGAGSAHAPRFVVLERPAAARGRAKAPTVVVIGKGVTFDTGGISLKRAEGMGRMKYDMSGAAAVLGLFHALPAIAPHARVIGLIPSAENAVGSRAMRPGDVLRMLDGTTVEITDTDAEGRLLLADALAFAKRFQPDAVVNLATLTGAITIALGRHYAGLFSAHDDLAAELERAGETVAERVWRMPVGEDYAAEMKSDTADLVNSNQRREGPASTAAAFLQHFAKGMRWAHLDIASTAWAYADRPHEPRGANAWGVRLLAEWVSRMGEK